MEKHGLGTYLCLTVLSLHSFHFGYNALSTPRAVTKPSSLACGIRADVASRSIVLNLHGEVLESLAPEGTTLEEAFLPTLKKLHERFPKLRIVVRPTHATLSIRLLTLNV